MTIHEYSYNEENGRLYVEFSTKKDHDKFYRTLDLSYEEIEYYSPQIITEIDLRKIDAEFIVDLILEYEKENDLPREMIL
jgi:hypothetical protein